MADILWHFGRPGERVVRRYYGVKPGVRLDDQAIAGMLPVELRQRVEAAARREGLRPVGATFDHQSGKVVPDVPGHAIDVAATVRDAWTAQRDASVRTVVHTTYARWRTEDIAGLKTALGHYRTWISGSSGRYENVAKGAGLINNRIVFPGQVFSTLGAIGNATKSGGWHQAPVIIWGSYQPGWGGGLCQVSSTLYNAVDRAGLKIVERHHHARQVHYVPHGRDATIAWPLLDFRFENNRHAPIILRAGVWGGSMSVTVLGRPEPAARLA